MIPVYFAQVFFHLHVVTFVVQILCFLAVSTGVHVASEIKAKYDVVTLSKRCPMFNISY